MFLKNVYVYNTSKFSLFSTPHADTGRNCAKTSRDVARAPVTPKGCKSRQAPLAATAPEESGDSPRRSLPRVITPRAPEPSAEEQGSSTPSVRRSALQCAASAGSVLEKDTLGLLEECFRHSWALRGCFHTLLQRI